MPTWPSELVYVEEMFGEVCASEIAAITEMTGVQGLTGGVLADYVVLQRGLSPAGEGAALRGAFKLYLIVVGPKMRFDIRCGLPPVVAIVAGVWLLFCMAIPHVIVEGRRCWTSHITIGTLVVIDVRSHMVSEEPF